ARQYLREAYELEPNFEQARNMYAATLITSDDSAMLRTVITDEYFTDFALDDTSLRAANQVGATDLLIELLEARIAARPQTAQNYASLAFVHYETDDIETAITVLEAGRDAIPSFAPTAACYINNLETGADPAAGC
ncbi:MAG: hypothetical protein R3B69_04260, partial [Candidatus Paceibacterota bacterium]